MSVTTIPVTVDAEASVHVAELGMQRELDAMLEFLRQNVPDLHRIDVTLQPPYDTGDDPGVIIEITRDDPHGEGDRIRKSWRDWKIDTYSPDIWRHFALFEVPGESHAR